jgi:hypothetical protein
MNPTDKQPVIPNPWNQILAQKHGQVVRAVRMALGTVCDASGKPKIEPAALRNQLKRISINANLAGDNIIIPGAQAGVKQIYELVLWNVGAQTLIFQQGTTGNDAITQLKLTNFPALTGFTLGFCGSWDFPHWEIDNGQPLILNLSGGGQVDGFVRYRVQNGTGQQ